MNDAPVNVVGRRSGTSNGRTIRDRIPVGPRFSAPVQTDRRTGMTKLIVTFLNFAKARENAYALSSLRFIIFSQCYEYILSYSLGSLFHIL